MVDGLAITDVQIIPVKPHDGLVALASVVLNKAIYLGSIGILVKLDGSFRVSYPTRPGAMINKEVFHPTSVEAAQMIQQAVLDKYHEILDKCGGKRMDYGPRPLGDLR